MPTPVELKVLQRAGIAVGPACRCPSHDVPPIAYHRGYQQPTRRAAEE